MEVKVINQSKNPLPVVSNHDSTGVDVRSDFSRIKSSEDLKGSNCYISKVNEGNSALEITINPFGRALIPTGLYTQIPIGFHIDVRPRSGLALKKGLTVLNTPGLIDPKLKN